MERVLNVGDPVVFLDTQRRKIHALVTQIHLGNLGSIEAFRQEFGIYPCINLVYVVPAEDMKDPYGRQTRHDSSVQYGDHMKPPRLGYCWLFPDEA